jgi:hypothetical protein
VRLANLLHGNNSRSQAVTSAKRRRRKLQNELAEGLRMKRFRSTDKCGTGTMLGKSDAADEVRKSRIGAQGIKIGMYFDELQNIRLLLEGLLDPGKSLLVFTEA